MKEECYIKVKALVEEINRRIQIMIKAENNAITTTMRYKYKVQKQALNSLWDWVIDTPWEVKKTED